MLVDKGADVNFAPFEGNHSLHLALALAGLGVSIDFLETAIEQEAWTGSTVFRARAEVVVPDSVSFDTVRAALEDISGEIVVDFDED